LILETFPLTYFTKFGLAVDKLIELTLALLKQIYMHFLKFPSFLFRTSMKITNAQITPNRRDDSQKYIKLATNTVVKTLDARPPFQAKPIQSDQAIQTTVTTFVQNVSFTEKRKVST
jgi:hypothetical protein